MKKIFALLALVLGVVSCQTEPEGLNVQMGGEQEVMLTVSLPETTRANSANGFDLNSLATTDYSLRYILEVYRVENDQVLYNTCQRFVETSDGTSMVFPVRLAQGYNYRIIAWTDIVREDGAVLENGEKADRCYKTTDGLDAVEIIESMWNPMDETRDAYTCVNVVNNFSSTSELDMTLTRPFAKLRVVATDIEDIRKVGLEPTTATVEYSQDMYFKYNAVADIENKGAANDARAKSHTFTYTTTATQYVDNNGEYTLFSDYIFVPSTGTAKFNLIVNAAAGKIKENNFNTEIFVERNKLTTIKGDVLTVGGNVEVKVENELGQLETINYADNAKTLQEIINEAPAGEQTNITLGGDIDLGDLFSTGTLSTRATAATLPIVIPEGKVVVLDLNGHNITTPWENEAAQKHYYAFDNSGSLTIQDSKGNGQIIARGIFNYGTLTLESGTINACDGNGGYGVRNYEGAEFIMNGGSIVTSYEDGDIPGEGYDASPVRVDEGATATINGGTINNVSNYTVAIDNYGTTTINDGTFTTIHTTIANSASMTINGGSFTCNGLEGVTAHALWAAAGTTTINGGTFNGKDNYNGFNVDADEGAIVNINGGKFLPVHSGSLYGKGTIIVKGGEFFDDPSARVVEGYKVVEQNGIYTIAEDPAAKIGDVKYPSLQAAVEAVQDGETITLLANKTFTEKNYYDNGGWKDGLGYAGDKSFTIDLGGFTIDQNGALNDYLIWIKNVGSKANTITIKNGTLDAGTTAFCALCTANSHDNQLTINLENITLINNISNGSTVKVRAGSVVNVKAGTKIIGKDSYLGIENWNATVNVYDGAEIYMNGTSSYNGCLIGVGGNGTINVYGGYGKGVSGGLIAMTSGGTINVSGGEWIANTDGTNANSNKSVLVAQSDKQYNAGAGNAIVNVTGGTFKGGYNCYGNAVGDAQINIKGGNFNANPASYVVAGYESKVENGVYTVGLPEALVKFLADIAKGGNVTLTADITLVESVVIESGKTVDLNLNGMTISGNWHKNDGAIIQNEGTLTIVGGTISSIGANGGSAIQNKGTLTVNDATLNGAPNANGSWPSYTVNNTGVMTLENTTITSHHGAVASYGDGALATLNNSTIDMAGIPGFTSHGIYTYNNGKVVVNDGTYANKATDQAASGASVINGAVEVNAGTFSGRIENYYGTPVLKGGTFSVKPNAKFVAAGYKAIEKNGKYYVVAEKVDNVVASKEDLPVENGKLDTTFEKDVNLYGDITVSANETNANSGYGATGVTVTNGAVLNGQGHKLTVNNAWGTWDCVVAAQGGTIKNLTVSGAMRGIFMPGANSDVYIDNVIFDNVIYTFNSDAGNKNYGVYISNSTLNGWTSHSDVHKEVIYTNCKFGEGNGYAFCRPYGTTSFVGCDFEAGFEVDAVGKITFESCTIGGVALTADNLATLVTSNTANASVK